MEFNPTRIFERYGLPLALMGVACLPLKLIFAYVAIIPLTFLWLIKARPELKSILKEDGWFCVPFLFFAASVAVSAFFGIDALRSFKALPSLLFFFFFILVIKELARRHGPFPFLYALAAGQSVAGLHSVFRGAFPSMPRLFLGQVTESGQLALSIMAIGGLAILLKRECAAPQSEEERAGLPTLKFSFFLCFSNAAFLIALGFRSHLQFAGATVLTLALALIPLGLAVNKSRKLIQTVREGRLRLFCAMRFIALSVVLPLLIAALVVNLKRGPWAGVLIGSTLLLFVFERRLVLPVLALFFSVLFFIEPVRERLLQSSRDFFIAGGRSVMWQIGAELATRYPLGVGYKNSPFLQKFSPQIPPELRHFHNNALNILVETGWVSLLLYGWWLFILVRSAFRYPAADPLKPLALGLGCALISWQVAGVVEYNIGDSEVVLLAYAMIGLLTALVKKEQSGG